MYTGVSTKVAYFAVGGGAAAGRWHHEARPPSPCMTDWLPWGAVVMAGTFTTLALVLRAIGKTPVGQVPDLRAARWALVASIVAALGVYAMYLITGEDWIWYF
jgi:hypothetical protein